MAGEPSAATSAAVPIPVTVDNFVRAESDRYFGVVAQQGGFGKVFHRRELMPIDKQTVVRTNSLNFYTLNNITAKKGADGSVVVQFGGCDGKIPNCIPIVKDWNYMVRLYRPRAELLNETWKFPEAQPLD
jgi:hypothetical protein